MNWLLIVVIGIFGLAVINGYRKGFLRIVFSLCALVLTFILVTLVSPKVSDFLEKETKLYEKIEADCIQKLEEGGNSQWIEELVGMVGYEKEEGTKGILQQIDISISEGLGKSLAKTILNGISFVSTFLLVSILLRLLISMLDIVTKIPVIKGVNSFMGMLVGAIQGLIIVWLAFGIILVISKTSMGVILMEQIDSNVYLSFLYEKNYILKAVMGVL